MILRIWMAATIALGTVLGAYAKGPPEQPGYASGDPQICLSCHGPKGMLPAADILSTVHGQRSNPRAPMALQGCQSCHGPSAQHLSDYSQGKPAKPAVTYDSQTSVESQNAACLSCHESQGSIHWQGSPHQFTGLACASCHAVHKPRAAPLLKSSQLELCFDCHREKRAQMHKTSAHPLAEQLMNCSDCHNPHGSPAEKLLTGFSVNETCYQCHAEKRGPFLWEHAPVRESCTHCHEPHGSVHQAMLVSRGPWLCQQCHMAAFHPSTAYSGTGIPPTGAAQQMLGKDCLNCHTQIHGSNHPSGVRLTR